METPDDTSWLDTETKAALSKLPPEKLAPAVTDTFAVVVLSLGSPRNRARHVRAFDHVLRTSPDEAEHQLRRMPPFVVKRELTLSDAMLAQFELICADVISIFLSDDVVANAEPEYLAALFHEMIHADEFETLTVRVVSIPDGAAGRAFARQFLGPHLPPRPFELVAMRKKARIMAHWANKIGAKVQVKREISGK